MTGGGTDCHCSLPGCRELEALTPNERDAIVRAGFVTDPDDMPRGLTERARRKADLRIAATEGEQANR